MAQGHILDDDTFALWRMDDANADPRTTGPLDSTGTRWTLPFGGSDIVVGPASRLYARRLLNARTLNGQMHRVSSPGDTAKCIGTWTVEAFVMFPTFAGYTNQIIFAHAGSAPDTSPYSDNILLSVCFFRQSDIEGSMFALWEHAAGANIVVSPTGGTARLASNTWAHVAFVKDSAAKTFTFWINGVQQGAAIAYVTEPTLGSAGNWILGRWASNGDPAEPAAQLAENSNMQIRDVSFSTVTRASAWMLANAARLTTTGTLITDGSTYFSMPMSDVAAIDSGPNGLDLFSESLVVDTNLAYPSHVNGGLIADGGRSKYFDACGLHHPTYRSDLRSVLLGSCTIEMWVHLTPKGTKLADGVTVASQGLFCFGVPGTETQVTNFFSIEVTTTGIVRWWVEHGAGLDTNILDTAPGTAPWGTLTHLAFVKEMTGATWTGRIYVNAVEVYEETGNTNYDGGTDPTSLLVLGRGDGVPAEPVNHLLGYMDDVRISSVARSAAEVAESYSRGIGSVGGGSLLSITASPVTRWVPIVARISNADDLIITFEAGTNRFTIYDSTKPVDEQWSGFFEDRSSIEFEDLIHTISILPNGGWWTSAFILRFNDTEIIGGDNSFTLEAP